MTARLSKAERKIARRIARERLRALPGRLRRELREHADVAALVLVVLLLGGANLLWTAHEVNANQAEQRRAGQLVERKLCTTLGSLAELKPPAGNPGSNPSRAYLQQEHDRLAQLGTDLGCR